MPVKAKKKRNTQRQKQTVIVKIDQSKRVVERKRAEPTQSRTYPHAPTQPTVMTYPLPMPTPMFGSSYDYMRQYNNRPLIEQIQEPQLLASSQQQPLRIADSSNSQTLVPRPSEVKLSQQLQLADGANQPDASQKRKKTIKKKQVQEVPIPVALLETPIRVSSNRSLSVPLGSVEPRRSESVSPTRPKRNRAPTKRELVQEASIQNNWTPNTHMKALEKSYTDKTLKSYQYKYPDIRDVFAKINNPKK